MRLPDTQKNWGVVVEAKIRYNFLGMLLMNVDSWIWALSVLILLEQTLQRWSFHLVEVG